MTVRDYARSDVYPPEVEAIADMSTCSDELHAHGCPCGVGGDAIERCYLCRRRENDRNVTLDGAVRGICDTCWERGEEGVLIPLDMTEDDDAD